MVRPISAWYGLSGRAPAARACTRLPPSLRLRSLGAAVGAMVLAAVLPPHDGPTAAVPVSMSDDGLRERDGVEAKSVVVKQLSAALEILRQYQPVRITTLGGECSVSVAPFSELANRYGDDLAIVWIDSHPDVGTPDSEYPGYHAMAVTALTGHGDPDVLDLLPAIVSPDRVALVGLHVWTEDDYPTSPNGAFVR